MPVYVTMHRSRPMSCHIDELMSVLWIAQGDVADAAVVRQLFQAVRQNFDNRCTAFIHNAGLILGFSSKSLYEKAPIVDERTQQQLLAVSTNPDITPSDTELDEYAPRPSVLLAQVLSTPDGMQPQVLAQAAGHCMKTMHTAVG